MKKCIFQNGLALGNAHDACSCSNINVDWIFKHPSNLLWVDKILVTKDMFKNIVSSDVDMKDTRYSAVEKSVKLIYQILDSVGLVQIIDDNIISSEERDAIYRQMADDIKDMEIRECDESNSELFSIGNYEYCIPALWTLYASILVSIKTNSSFSLDEREFNYLSYLLNATAQPVIPARSSSAITSVMEVFLPEMKLGHDYLFDSNCPECANKIKCSDSYLSVIESQTFAILKERGREEIIQLQEVLDGICQKYFNDLTVDIAPKELLRQLNIEKQKVQEKVLAKYQKVERWSSLASTIVSVGTAGAALLGHPVLSAALAVSIPVIDGINKRAHSDNEGYKWVNFVNSRIQNTAQLLAPMSDRE